MCADDPSGHGVQHVPQGEKREAADTDVQDEQPAKRSRLEYLEIYYGRVEKLVQARTRKEVRINDLRKKNQACFRKAIEKEIQNNLQIGAYKAISLEESARVRQQERVRDKPAGASGGVSRGKPFEISALCGSIPLRLDPADVLDFSRPRFAWLSDAPHEQDEVAFIHHKGFIEVNMRAARPASNQWLRPGWTWRDEGKVWFPSFISRVATSIGATLSATKRTRQCS